MLTFPLSLLDLCSGCLWHSLPENIGSINVWFTSLYLEKYRPHTSKQIQACVIHYLLCEMWWHGIFSLQNSKEQSSCWKDIFSDPPRVDYSLMWVAMALLLSCSLNLSLQILFAYMSVSPIPNANFKRTEMQVYPCLRSLVLWMLCFAVPLRAFSGQGSHSHMCWDCCMPIALT